METHLFQFNVKKKKKKKWHDTINFKNFELQDLGDILHVRSRRFIKSIILRAVRLSNSLHADACQSFIFLNVSDRWHMQNHLPVEFGNEIFQITCCPLFDIPWLVLAIFLLNNSFKHTTSIKKNLVKTQTRETVVRQITKKLVQHIQCYICS